MDKENHCELKKQRSYSNWLLFGLMKLVFDFVKLDLFTEVDFYDHA